MTGVHCSDEVLAGSGMKVHLPGVSNVKVDWYCAEIRAVPRVFLALVSMYAKST